LGAGAIGVFGDLGRLSGVSERPAGPLHVQGAGHVDTVVPGDQHAPTCEHGEWTFAGTDYKRQATKWRCPTGECQPKSTWIKADRLHPLIPRHTERSAALYKSRGAVEREFGRLKHEWALLPLRVRGLERVQLHADLTILAKLGCALARA